LRRAEDLGGAQKIAAQRLVDEYSPILAKKRQPN